jgi:hypothetical protein
VSPWGSADLIATGRLRRVKLAVQLINFLKYMSLTLFDYSGAELGEIHVDSQNEVVLGTFAPTPEFLRHQLLFESFEQAANDLLFIEVDRMQREIHSLGFYAVDTRDGIRKAICNLQIMEAGISFYWGRQRVGEDGCR